MRRYLALVMAGALGTTVLSSASAAASSTCFGRAPTIVGTSGDDAVEGTPGTDIIDAGDGEDIVRGKEGHDFICGGATTSSLAGPEPIV